MNMTLKSRPPVAGVGKPMSELALGTAFYGFDNKELWFEILDGFVACGGSVIDSARLYGNGDSEELVGLWMETRAVRDKVVLITKCGHGKDGYLPTKNFKQMVTEELTTSLDCLKTDYVDLYMLHRDNPLVPVAEILDCLNVEVAHGRVRAIGASNWEYSRVDEAHEYADKHGLKGFAAISNNLSLAVPTESFYPGLVSVDKAGERWHARTGIPLISWSSGARGFFTGRYAPEMRCSAESIENPFARRMLDVYCTDENFERLSRAKELGKKKGGYSAVQVALAWVLHRPLPVVPIVGPHSREELASCVEATSIQLTQSEMKWLNIKA